MKTARVAMCQMRVEGGRKKENLIRADRIIDKAARAGADVALLPECLDLGWTDPSASSESEPIPGGMAFQKISRAAAAAGIYVCAGLTERDGDTVYNSAVLIGRDGALLGKHRKLNELDFALDCYRRGGRIGVVETEIGTVGIMICADAFVDSRIYSRALGSMGADMILSPCAWAVPEDHDNDAEPYGELWRSSYVPVAREYGVAIVGVSNVGRIRGGPWAGRHCIGSSLAIDCQGREILQAPYGVNAEAMPLADIHFGRTID